MKYLFLAVTILYTIILLVNMQPASVSIPMFTVQGHTYGFGINLENLLPKIALICLWTGYIYYIKKK